MPQRPPVSVPPDIVISLEAGDIQVFASARQWYAAQRVNSQVIIFDKTSPTPSDIDIIDLAAEELGVICDSKAAEALTHLIHGDGQLAYILT